MGRSNKFVYTCGIDQYPDDSYSSSMFTACARIDPPPMASSGTGFACEIDQVSEITCADPVYPRMRIDLKAVETRGYTVSLRMRDRPGEGSSLSKKRFTCARIDHQKRTYRHPRVCPHADRPQGRGVVMKSHKFTPHGGSTIRRRESSGCVAHMREIDPEASGQSTSRVYACGDRPKLF